jgi:hypothetical protein
LRFFASSPAWSPFCSPKPCLSLAMVWMDRPILERSLSPSLVFVRLFVFPRVSALVGLGFLGSSFLHFLFCFGQNIAARLCICPVCASRVALLIVPVWFYYRLTYISFLSVKWKCSTCEAYAERFLRQVWPGGRVLAKADRLAMSTVPKVVLQGLLSEGGLH